MANSFPGSVKTFQSKTSGQVIGLTHLTDLDQEVSAIETVLLNGPLTMGNSTVNTVFSAGSLVTTGNVAFGNTSASGFGRLVSWGGASGTATSSGAFVTPGTAQSEKSDLALYSTFEGTADNGPRRTADIIAGFNGGAWGYEYLAFNVGNGGSANDTKVVTSEKMRLDANGNLGLGNTTPSTPGGTRNFYMTSAGTTIMRVHSTVANTGQARFDWTTPAPNGYVIAGLYEQSGAGPYFQISSGSGVVDGIYDLPTHVFRISGTERWRVSTGGHFLAGTDNTSDIGASGATRPRNTYVANSVVVGANVTVNTSAILIGNSSVNTIATSTSIVTGNSTVNTTYGVGQIAFPATQNASADANTLDDYEEGTWTPTLGGTATYTTQTATYTKIGRQVHVRFRLKVNAIGTGSTSTVSGLPFTSADVYSGVISYYVSLATSVYSLTCYTSGTTVLFTGQAALDANIDNGIAIWGNSAEVIADITYFV